ncbi:hypothetical protein [Asanoa siamensis]|uniref:HAF family extracellular repeat protein n=1 Tax=Asanoa siamensis TaxID=926357 RepID=A0ABQ4CQJ3_9ACTN|nr:hypothetical protein [Asanoa siamensis]GIF73560.1 hypothetical protein Asi02nite_30780 [Asanoa siamensis]
MGTSNSVRWWRLAGSFFGVLVVASAAMIMQAPATAALTVPSVCAVDNLPVPDMVPRSVVTAADPTGRFIFGRSYPEDGTHQVLLWDNGQPSKIVFSGIDPAIASVNSAGVAIGYSYNDEGAPVAYVYRGGTVTGLPDGTGVWANSINADGVIVGTRDDNQPLIWHTPTSTPAKLRLPIGYDRGAANAIDDDGVVVGEVYNSANPTRVPFVWDSRGVGHALPLPSGGNRRFGSVALQIRNGWIIGVDRDWFDSQEKGVRWNLRLNILERVPGMFGPPRRVNNSGWMVGTDSDGHGVMSAGGRMVRLKDAFFSVPETYVNLPISVSDDGKIIAGTAEDESGTVHAVVWECG